MTVLTLAPLSASAPLATAMYLPTFPQLAAELSTSAAAVQLTLTTYLIGLALGQLIIGSLSDQWGRRVLLLRAPPGCRSWGGVRARPEHRLVGGSAVCAGIRHAAGIALSPAVISDRAVVADNAR
ncbi:MFS transporter [Saccharopolyspora sp. NPDC000995]